MQGAGKEVGDEITLLTDEGEKHLTVCGIYSDITMEGKQQRRLLHRGPRKLPGVPSV